MKNLSKEENIERIESLEKRVIKIEEKTRYFFKKCSLLLLLCCIIHVLIIIF